MPMASQRPEVGWAAACLKDGAGAFPGDQETGDKDARLASACGRSPSSRAPLVILCRQGMQLAWVLGSI